MKISKLFHWLYACIMLLPIFAIGGKLLYVAFNPNAKDSFYGETINDKEVVTITNINNLQVNRIYHLQQSMSSIASSNLGGSSYYLKVENVYYPNVDTSNVTRISMYVRANTNYATLYFRDSNNNQVAYLDTNNIDNNIDYYFTYLGYYQYDNIINDLLAYVQPKQFIYNNLSFMDNALYFAVNQINEEPLFAWAKDSFLVEPFHYIGGLFGMPNNSPIYTMLSYWLNISITWLVFDLVMYVPLLAHRWLDKGVLE